MIRYVFTINIEGERTKSQIDSINEYLADTLVDEIKQKCNDDKAILDVMLEDGEYHVFSSNSLMAKEYLSCVKEYLGNIVFSVSIGLNNILTVKTLDDSGQELDAIDYLNSKVKIDDSITDGKAVTTEVSYIYERNGTLYGLNMKVVNLNQLRIVLNADVASTEETKEMVSLFDKLEEEYKNMFGSI